MAMRIVIEHDTTAAITSGTVAAAASVETENGGAAPAASAADAAGDHDGGGPPQWLLDALGRTKSAPGAGTDAMSDATDGGAAPRNTE
jgi:hypothetical protein